VLQDNTRSANGALDREATALWGGGGGGGAFYGRSGFRHEIMARAAPDLALTIHTKCIPNAAAMRWV
jgi:hypothetical protein